MKVRIPTINAGISIAYIVSRYPTISHTFILREIQELRNRGHNVKVYAVREPHNAENLGKEEKREHENTTYLLKSIPLNFIGALVRLMISEPMGVLRMLYHGIKEAFGAGAKSIKYPFYFCESVLLLDDLLKSNIGHVHNHFGNAAAVIAQLASYSGTVSFSISIHGPDIFNNVREERLASKLNTAKFVRTISHYASSQVALHGGHETAKKTYTVRCGVDTERYRYQERITRNVKPRLLCVGRLCAAKAQINLLQTSLQLTQQGCHHSLFLVGGGKLEKELRLFANSNAMSWITFCGPLSQKDTLETFQEADIFVLPSYAEGIPVALMEAMSVGLPVISTFVAGIPELIENEKSGLLVPPCDNQSLFFAMRRLIRDSALRTKIGRQGRLVVEQQYNLKTNGRQMAILLEKEMDERR